MPRRAGGRSVTSRPAEPDRARGRPDEAGERVERGRLARSARSEQRDGLPARDPQVEVDQRLGRLVAAPVGHADAVESDCRRGGFGRLCCSTVACGGLAPGLTPVSAIISYRWPSGKRPDRRRARRARRSSPAPRRRRRRALPAGVFGCGGFRCGGRIESSTGMPSASGATVFCTSSESRKSSSFFGVVGVRRTLGDTRDVGHRDGGALAVGTGWE